MADVENGFKAAIAARQPQVGLWLALGDAYSAELAASCGYDWYVIDCEHSPNTILTVVSQLQALKGCGGEPVVRIPVGDFGFLKQVTDAGCRTVLAPMVESADQARDLAEAMRYPPAGRRGVGSALARASAFGADAGYLMSANDRACLLVQVETVKGMAALDEICAVDGVDGVFIGTADLAADMGYLGQPGAAPVQEALLSAAKGIAAHGLPVGALTSDVALAQSYFEAGLSFVAVGNDVSVLRVGLSALRLRFDHA